MTMLTEDRVRAALAFLEAADREFAEGDAMQASEKLWGAATQAVMAVAVERDWPYGSHTALRIAVRRLSEEYNDRSIRTGFGFAEKFHANFYHGFMDDLQIEDEGPEVRDFVHRVTGLLAGNGA
jgi:hypothetical protein